MRPPDLRLVRDDEQPAKRRKWTSWAWWNGDTPEQQLARSRRALRDMTRTPRMFGSRRRDHELLALQAEVAQREAVLREADL